MDLRFLKLLRLRSTDLGWLFAVFVMAGLAGIFIESTRLQRELTQTMQLWSGEIVEEFLRTEKTRLIPVLDRQLRPQGIEIRHLEHLHSNKPRIWSAPPEEMQGCFLRQQETLELSLIPFLKVELCVTRWAFIKRVLSSDSFGFVWIVALAFLILTFYLRTLGEIEQKKAQQLMEIAEQKAQFAGQLAHDLRAPLGALQVLLDQQDQTQGGSEQLPLLKTAVSRLETMSQELAGKSVHRAEIINTKSWFEELKRTLDTVAMNFSEQSFKLNVYQAPLIWVNPLGGEKLLRMVQNLVINGWEAQQQRKVSPPLLIEIEFDAKQCLIKVKDQGCGVTPEHLAELGKRGKTFGKEHGTGLGLFQICNWTEQVGGKVEFLPHQPQGLEVRVYLPFSG